MRTGKKTGRWQEMGASDVGDGHRCRRSRTSWKELEDRADGGLGRRGKSSLNRMRSQPSIPPQNHPNFPLISSVRKRLFCSGGKVVLSPEFTAQQPSEHVFVHDPSSACCEPPHAVPDQVRVSLFSLILGFSIRIHASTQEPSRVAGRGPLIQL